MKTKIDRKAYLAYARSFTEREQALIHEFQEWLPDEIIDCHAHCNLPEHTRSIDERTYNHMLSTFPSFSLEESKEWHALLHPGKTIRSLRFPKTFRGINHRAANLYLLNGSEEMDRVALYGLPDDPEYTVEMLVHPRVSALKMYYSYIEPPATEIYQYFPKVVLEVAQERDVPIILHPPRRITICLDQIIKLVKKFPRLRVCLAHLSLTKSVVPGLEEAFTAIVAFPQIHLDTALVPSSEVVEMAMRIVGPNRIMYGSDEPLHLIRSVPYLHPQKGERLATEYPYHWVDPTDYQVFKHLTVGVTHAHWQALQAIKTAVSALPKGRQGSAKQKLFHDNAKMFYGF
jgi:predicted TIM-barrel fold metal-dependent hydrolase